MNFARIWCIPNPTPARRVTPPWNVYTVKFDPGWEGYLVWQTGLPALGGHTHLSCKRDQIRMRDYMDRKVTPPKRVISPTWGPPPPRKQTLSRVKRGAFFGLLTRTKKRAMGLLSKTTTFYTCITLYCTFLCRHCATTTCKCLIHAL